MNIASSKHEMQRALSWICQGIAGRSPILDGVLRVRVSAEEGVACLSMGSAKLCTTYCFNATVEEPGALYVSFQALCEALRQAQDQAVLSQGNLQEELVIRSQHTSATKSDHLAVTFACGDWSLTVDGTPASQYSWKTAEQELEGFTLPADLFSEVLGQVVFAASTNEHVSESEQKFLNVWFNLPGDETLALAACDRSQLAYRQLKVPGALVNHGTIQIPAEACAALALLLSTMVSQECECEIQVVPEVDQRRMRFVLPQGEIILPFAPKSLLPREPTMPFTPFASMIPQTISKRHKTRIIVERDSIMWALRSARGLVHMKLITGAGGEERLLLEIYRKGREETTVVSVPIVRWSGQPMANLWFDAGFLKRALSSSGTQAVVVLDVGGKATSPVVLRWMKGRAIRKDYAYAFGVRDPYFAQLSTRTSHILSPLAERLAEQLPQQLAERRERGEIRLLREAVVRIIVHILDCGLAPTYADVVRIAKSVRAQQLLTKEVLEKLSLGSKRERVQRMASVSELIAILAFARGGYVVPELGLHIVALAVQKAFLAMKEMGV